MYRLKLILGNLNSWMINFDYLSISRFRMRFEDTSSLDF